MFRRSWFVLPFFLIGCSDSPPGPPPPNGPDTTSHNFFFDIDTLGDGNSSTLYDVAVVNDSLAYAVGEMYLRDSSGQLDPRRYNLAVWTETSWTVRRLTYQGSATVIRSVFAFAENDVWLDPWFHWNGQTFQEVPISPVLIGVGVNKMWGSPDGQLHVVGNGGFIARRSTSGTWQRMESGTTLPLLDVFGSSANGVYAVGGDRSTAVVLKYDGTRWLTLMNSYYFGNGFDSTELFRTQLFGHLSGTWVDESGTLYVVGEYVYRMNGGRWSFVPGIADNYLNAPIFSRGFLTSVRGWAKNDFVTLGERITVIHYNGATGIQVGPQFSFASPVDFYRVDMKGSFIVGVGTSGDRAVVVRLNR